MSLIGYSFEEIEEKVDDLLRSYNITEGPVKIEDIARHLGVNVLPFDLGEGISGILHIKEQTATIGYNPTESSVRQRFTMAHELGHFILHKEADEIFVDNKVHYQMKFRKNSSNGVSAKTSRQEQEANIFAAALLMPKTILKRELLFTEGVDLTDSTFITELAKKFQVSSIALSLRIVNLKLLQPFGDY